MSRHERLLYLAAHPVAYPFLRLVARLGPAVRVPGLGVVVNDATLAHAVLRDPATFRKDGPGSSGALWTPVVGPSVLLNMEGAEHRALRRRLSGLFTPAYVDQVCARVLAEPLAALANRLAAGQVVDLVDVTRVCAGAVICALLGLPANEDEHRRMFTRGEQITAMVRLSTKELSARQVATARRVLGEITAPAAGAYAAGDPATVLGRMRRLGLAEDEALGAAAALFLTGTETVATFVPRLVALLCDTGVQHRVAAEPALLDRAIDEAFRLTTPTPAMLRSVAGSARIGPVAVRPGDRVVIATHNCARAHGGRFDPDRPRPRALNQLWFGAGAHYCLGYPVAMAEIRAIAGTVLRHAPLRIVRRRYATGVLIPTYSRLAVRHA
ncbi:MAG TPA: cytochrome P450 [Micromonosporaceae bacterium]|nr:cytochrome P450 [Micromonosporaceae bacterium]